ncbi:oxygen-regulated protein 1 [Melanotaenia boesemani]|uniref:oxygen-regulated protein 1 n=1 Tax=Melanotaenia boesemani TaxID=1250792 RepID=UPI001C05B228|nr:oxygen-regulated protein 1 [Melanotaenia boesemani]
MSSTPVQDPPAQGMSSDSGQTLPSRPLQPSSDPSVSKRVCFYKSGDYKFSGHRMIITGRTFKTFDALLDALSKKVPLPFGVRTICTPQGTHLVKALDDLQDGGAYVCSDQKRVKPLNLDEVNRRQVPWNTTRPLSAGRQRRQGLRLGQFGRENGATNRPAKVTDRMAVRTPKKLVVIKNRDPTVKRTIVLQRRTAPTFDALLDYLSQILQFPVLKIYSTDGRRVDGLAALILCSGIVVAAGNEPFRLGNHSSHRTAQMAQIMHIETGDPPMLQPGTQKNKSFSSGRGSKNFSLSSERYIINQINKSQNGSMNNYLHHSNRSFEPEANQHHTSITCEAGREDNENHTCIIPNDDDIEKSFCVNQDGSMTVEMKVRLTLKEEEMLHWTTTLSRSSLSKRTVCASLSGSGNSSPDSNNAIAKDSSNIQEDETKEENYHVEAGKGVGFNDERLYEGYTSTSVGKAKGFKRSPTPGPRHVNKKTSVESLKRVTEAGVQESTLGHYSYMERTANGETTEGYCVVRHSSSSNRPVPKPRKTASAEMSNNCPSIRSSEVAEVLQIRNDGMEVTETVMHIYESQGCYDNYFANEEYSADDTSLHDSPSVAESKPSTDSSSNDCDIDCNWQPPTADSQQRQKEEMLSLSSEPESHQVTNNLTLVTDKEAHTAVKTVKNDNTLKSTKEKSIVRPAGNQKSSVSTSSTDKKQKDSIISSSKRSKYSSTDKLSSDASVGQKSQNSLKSSRSDPKKKKTQRPQSTKSIKDEKSSRKDTVSLVGSQNLKINSQSTNKLTAKDNGHNVNTPTGRPPMKKNMSEILQTKKSSSTTTIRKPKSMTEYNLSPPKKSVELSESGSMPSLNPSPSEVHQYVETWLEKVSPDQVPYIEEPITDVTEPRTKVVFKIGGDSESDELDGSQNTLNDALKKSSSCLSVPLCHEEPSRGLLQIDQRTRGLCVSMPSVRADPEHQENRLWSHKSAEAICPNESETSSASMLSPKAKIKPVLRQLCSSIQCIRRASTSNTPTLHNSNSLPDFSTQVASVFGSSCKAFLSFLSVMTLRESLKGSTAGESDQSRTTSEAMLMMESLQKISVVEDEEAQRASLTDLQSQASSQFRERWKDFQILRERLESEPLSPKVSETEFALDVVSEGGDVFEDQNLGIDELMEELNMPQDLREEITSTFQHAKSFYPVEESTYVETVQNHSDSEEDVEQFIQAYNDEIKHSPELDSIAEETKQVPDEPDQDLELETERDEPSKYEEMEAIEHTINREYGNTTNIDADEENDKEDLGMEDEKEDGGIEEDETNKKWEDWEENKENDQESVVKVAEETEEELTGDEDERGERLEEGEKEEAEETDEGLVDEETEEDGSVKDTDEREGDEETEEEEKGEKEETEETHDQSEEEELLTVINEGQEDDEDSSSEDKEEEEEGGTEKMGGVMKKKDEEEEIDGEEEEEEADAVTGTLVDEEVMEEKGEENEDDDEEEEKEHFAEVLSEGNNEEEENEEEEDKEQEVDNCSENETDKEKWDYDEDSRNILEKTRSSGEEETAEMEEVIDELEGEENMTAEQTVDEEEGNGDEENELNEGLKQMGAQPKDEAEKAIASEDVDSFADDEDSKNVLGEAPYLQQHTSSCEEAKAEHDTESSSKNSSEGQCEDDKYADTVNETDEGGEEHEERSSSLSHPVEISQELLDFVNYALQSCSLVFTYDTQGKIKLEPDNARVVQTKQMNLPQSRKDSSYGLKCLPSPITSDLSDYRPETSESGGYKTQESVDVVSESGEEASRKQSPVHSYSGHSIKTAIVKQTDSKVSLMSSSEALLNSRLKSAGSFSSSDAGIKVSREDLSCFSAASSLKGNTEASLQNVQCTSDKESADGVLIDRGRWLLKENHLIRKSPPVSLGMYNNLDSTSIDTGQDNTSEDSPPHTKTQHSPLAAISSSELEELAKPLTPKCTYFNMPHGSDSDPFLDDSSIRSGKRDASSVRGRGFRVSPTVDTSKTWANRNGSLSSFASVEFKIPDRKVHPEGESSAVTQARRTSNGEQGALQAQNSLDSLHLRCGQYCPIL